MLVPTREPEPLRFASVPVPDTTFHDPVEPFSPNLALRRSVRVEPLAHVNTLSPTKTPPHGVKCAADLSAFATMPPVQPAMLDVNGLESTLKSVLARIQTDVPGGAATAGAAPNPAAIMN